MAEDDDFAQEVRIERLEQRFKRFSMLAGPDIDVSGSIPEGGYAVNLTRRVGGISTTGPTGPTGPPPTGACCFGNDCEELSAADCATAGGLYQGDGVPCDPSPCATGACCLDNVCSEGTEAFCDEMGGIFQGPDTTCDPDPCQTGACCFGADCVEPISQSDCETSEGLYLGDGSTCFDPGCPTGACCFGGDCFEGYTASTCANAAGVYQGDDSVCDPNPCGGCPSITMTCDSISASKTKCGFFHDGKYYLQRDVESQFPIVSNIGGGQFCLSDPDARLDFFGSGSFFESMVSNVAPSTCTETDDPCAISGSVTITRSQTGIHEDKCDDYYTACQTHSVTLNNCSDIIPAPAYHFADTGGCGPVIILLNPASVTNYNVEYTTALLISTTEDALPPYSGVYTGGACASSRYLSSDENTYSIQRSKPKFTFSATTIDFNLCYNEVFTPAGGGGTTINNQCIFVSAGQTEVFGPELFEPPDNGTVSILDITCTPA